MRLLSTMRSAIILRMRSICIISSPPLMDAGTNGAAEVRTAVAATVWPSLRCCTYCKISFLVTRPSAPEPAMFSSSTNAICSSLAMFFTKGE